MMRRSLKLVDAASGALGDYPPAYASWAQQVKAQGGAAVVWPSNLAPASSAGQPAARYPAATYQQLVSSGAIDANAQQQATANGQYVYVLANSDVAAAAPALSAINPDEEAGLEAGFWAKFGLPDLTKYVKYAAIAGGVILGGVILLKLLPSRRSNPPRRRRRSRRGR